MKETAAVEKYAQALFLALRGKKAVSPEEIGKELAQVFKLLFANENLKSALESPLIPMEQKKTVIRRKLEPVLKKESFLLKNFIELVVSKKRLNLLPLIVARFGKIVQESKNSVKAMVKSTVPLDEPTKKEMERKLSNLFKRDVVIESSLHPELLAGIVVQAGDVVIDNSLRTQLKNLSQHLESEVD